MSTKQGDLRLTLLLDITHHQHFLEQMQRLIWLCVGLSALATALLGAWVARRGLRPLRQMTRVTQQVSASSLTARLAADALPAELGELAASFNAMLARLKTPSPASRPSPPTSPTSCARRCPTSC